MNREVANIHNSHAKNNTLSKMTELVSSKLAFSKTLDSLSDYPSFRPFSVPVYDVHFCFSCHLKVKTLQNLPFNSIHEYYK